MPRKIVITSGKGGVGKSTVTVELARALADLSQRVVIIDADLSLGNIDIMCEVEQKVMFDIVDCIRQKCRVKQALVQDSQQPSLYVLAGGSRGLINVSKEELLSVTNQLAGLFDYVLLDSSAGISLDFEKSAYCATEAILVCTPHLSSLRDTSKAIKSLLDFNLSNRFCVVNRVRGDLVVKGKMLSAFEVFSLIDAKPLGVIPECDDINCSQISEEARGYFEVLAKNLHFGKNIMLDCESAFRKFLPKRKQKV